MKTRSLVVALLAMTAMSLADDNVDRMLETRHREIDEAMRELRGDSKEFVIKLTFKKDNQIAECVGDPDDLLDFLQIVIVEQRREEFRFWKHKQDEVADWLHERSSGLRKEFVKVAKEVYDKNPLRIELRHDWQKKGLAKAVEIWNTEKPKSYFGDDKTNDRRRIDITNPTPNVKSIR